MPTAPHPHGGRWGAVGIRAVGEHRPGLALKDLWGQEGTAPDQPLESGWFASLSEAVEIYSTNAEGRGCAPARDLRLREVPAFRRRALPPLPTLAASGVEMFYRLRDRLDLAHWQPDEEYGGRRIRAPLGAWIMEDHDPRVSAVLTVETPEGPIVKPKVFVCHSADLDRLWWHQGWDATWTLWAVEDCSPVESWNPGQQWLWVICD